MTALHVQSTWGIIAEVLASDKSWISKPLGMNQEVQELVWLSLGSNGSKGFSGNWNLSFSIICNDNTMS